MNIAIVGPSPIPYTIGGMEYLLWGLQEHINKDTQHKAELIKLPTDESSFWSVINSYKQFHNLDLSHFDMVITTKYPAWMIKHHNHVCYMAHRLRGLYDTYHFTKLPLELKTNNSHIDTIIKYIEKEDSSEEGLFALLDRLYEIRNQVPKEYFAFPGPFIRKIIHFLDGKALSKERVKRFCSISKTVKKRDNYFPSDISIEVIYPPSFLSDFKTGSYDYLFTISRLDNAKRVSLMVQAMKYVKHNIKFKIAGTGPMEEELKAMASGDKRIEFLGFVSDDEAIDYYANALGVLYLPYDEDYGLVTIEAMMSKKPVITCNDSGGTNEFVVDGETGFIADSNPKSIASQINKLCSIDENKLYYMGEKAYEKVKNIKWKYFISDLIDEKSSKSSNVRDITKIINRRKKITVTSTFSIYPPKGGGQARIYNLYKNVAREFDVEVVSFTNYDDKYYEGEIASNMKEIRVPKSQLHQEKEWDLERKVGIPITDVAMPKLAQYSSEYVEKLKESIENSDVIVISHPYLLYEAKKYMINKPFVYESHNVEYLMKKEILPKNKTSQMILEWVYEVEKECCRDSEFIMTCSEEDRIKLSELYNVSIDKIIVVPNGVDTESTLFVDLNKRAAFKKDLGLQDEKLALFMGSWHPPNLEACEYIFEFAKETPDIKYLLMGSQCLAFKDRNLPQNVGLLGLVSEEQKQKIFGIVDIALNPMVSGSGTNLKMFDYMAAGIPVITTEFGARGIEDKENLIISNIDEFSNMIKKIFGHHNIQTSIVYKARKYVEETFDWKIIGAELANKINEKCF